MTTSMILNDEFASAHPDILDVVDRWQTEIAPLMVPSHCILASRTLVRLFPDRCVARTVDGLFANQTAHSLLPYLNGRPLETLDPAAWTVGFVPGGQMEGRGYNGHVIVVVDDRWIVDLSAAQFDRPQHAIHVPGPLVLDMTGATGQVSPIYPDGQVWKLRDVRTGARGWVHYALVPDDSETWRGAPDWRFASRSDRVINALNNK